LSPGGRVPGRERGPVRPLEAPGGAARQLLRRRRRRAVDLHLDGGGPLRPGAVRPRLRDRPAHRAGQELSLLAPDLRDGAARALAALPPGSAGLTPFPPLRYMGLTP